MRLQGNIEKQIIAHKNSGAISNTLVIECKKSEDKPWVFIKHEPANPGFALLDKSVHLNIAYFRQDCVYYQRLESAMKLHDYSSLLFWAYYVVPFTKENSKQEKSIFKAKTRFFQRRITSSNHLKQIIKNCSKYFD